MRIVFILLAVFLYFLTACSPFNKFASATKIGQEDLYTCVVNEKVNFKSLTYGDFQFAINRKEFKQLNNKKPAFDDILFYAKTKDPTYEYYILLNPKVNYIQNDEFQVIDTLIDEQHIKVIISENAPKSDVTFIKSNIQQQK